MFFLTKKVTGGKKHISGKNKEHNYATFVTNAEFLKNISEKIGCSINYVQKYLMAFNEIGIIKKLGNVGRNGTLYANGYYVEYGDQYRKEVFLKSNRVFKLALRTFDPLAIQKAKNRKLKIAAADNDDINEVINDKIMIAARLLNRTGLAAFKIKTTNINLSEMKKQLWTACGSIPASREEFIPRYVIDVCDKLSEQY